MTLSNDLDFRSLTNEFVTIKKLIWVQLRLPKSIISENLCFFKSGSSRSQPSNITWKKQSFGKLPGAPQTLKNMKKHMISRPPTNLKNKDLTNIHPGREYSSRPPIDPKARHPIDPKAVVLSSVYV